MEMHFRSARSSGLISVPRLLIDIPVPISNLRDRSRSSFFLNLLSIHRRRMSLPNENPSTQRRSTRNLVPTLRAEQYREHRDSQNRLHPDTKDDIYVRWILEGEKVWWPATVIKLQPSRIVHHEFRGSLLYHKFRTYPAEPASVIFFLSAQNERLVRSAAKSNESASSWVFMGEGVSDEEDANVCGCHSDDDNTPSDDGSTGSSQSTTVRPTSSAIKKKRGTKRSTMAQTNNNDLRPQTAISKPSRNARKKRLSATLVNHTPMSQALVDRVNDEQAEIPTTAAGPSKMTSVEKSELEVRLRLVERRLQDVSMVPTSNLSSSAHAIIVSLRWSMLRYLEKPLKYLNLPGISTHGVGSHRLSVSVQCDYNTLRELADTLAKEHPRASNQPTKSRVAFSPSFHKIQSGSSASDNMNIIFTSLADLSSFLGIRDDNDFEAILSKEVLSESTSLLRILGTCTHKIDFDSEKQSSDSTKSMNSVSASSEVVPNIRLFVGTAPVDYVMAEKGNVHSYAEHETFQSTLLQQEGKHFCSGQKCYRTPWSSQPIQSDLSVRSKFDLDGTVSKDDLNNYFTLNWSRQAAPSAVKWTRDVHNTANNSPGVLRLSIPFIFFSSTKNVRSLVSMLDSHIETFMKIRSIIHNQSSFK